MSGEIANPNPEPSCDRAVEVFIIQPAATTFNPSGTTDLAWLMEQTSKQMLFLAQEASRQFFDTADVAFSSFIPWCIQTYQNRDL